MTAVTRATLAGRAYLDLQNKARKDGRTTDELIALYAIEGILARLWVSAYVHQRVLKGGVLLAAFGRRRRARGPNDPTESAPVMSMPDLLSARPSPLPQVPSLLGHDPGQPR